MIAFYAPPTPHATTKNMASLLFFFYKSKYIYRKAQRGATQSTQEVYKGEPKGRGRNEKENPEN
jgi:hypothetical protein